MKKIIIFFGLIFFLSATVSADTKKVKVIDGDTIHIGTDEKFAKENRLGIWSMSFQMPSDYRKASRNK
ncbi:MAG: hypothetical protein EBZ90_03005 [Proteobacteria bacterium]|nr:hypothetical protein [Pseudomonadota bacterium]